MSDHIPEHHDSIGVRTVQSHQFLTMVVLVILLSLFLVYVALSLYQSSGTLQLDLSRPGYDSARQEAIKDNQVFNGYSADGPIDKASLSQFDTLYKQKAAEALINIDAFSGDALSDAALALDRD
jgi:murein L,D-transpeptidase YcbB/YkuD